jgi:hypothetical protein
VSGGGSKRKVLHLNKVANVPGIIQDASKGSTYRVIAGGRDSREGFALVEYGEETLD